MNGGYGESQNASRKGVYHGGNLWVKGRGSVAGSTDLGFNGQNPGRDQGRLVHMSRPRCEATSPYPPFVWR
jgi:hypothetical protein